MDSINVGMFHDTKCLKYQARSHVFILFYVAAILCFWLDSFDLYLLSCVVVVVVIDGDEYARDQENDRNVGTCVDGQHQTRIDS